MESLRKKKSATVGIGANVLFLVAVVFVFVVIMVEVNKDKPKTQSPFDGPAPAMAGGSAAQPRSTSAPSDQGAVSGTIDLDPGLTAPPPGGTLFVVARPGGLPAVGPPLAVKRISVQGFPVDFSVGPKDVMMEGLPFTGPLDIHVRLDLDGNAMTKDPEDLVVDPPQADVNPGQSGLRILLNKRAKDLSAAATPAQGPHAGVIRGEVRLAPSLGGAPKGGEVFVMLRRPGADPNSTPLLVRKLGTASFPARFEIEAASLPKGELGPFELHARWDADGDALTKAPGDLLGVSAQPVSPGGEEVPIVLTERISK